MMFRRLVLMPLSDPRGYLPSLKVSFRYPVRSPMIQYRKMPSCVCSIPRAYLLLGSDFNS
jgi:hypothetical protein